ncbi:hypothetical protein CWIS_08200, partial [Cellulomonas sp. A375-1]
MTDPSALSAPPLAGASLTGTTNSLDASPDVPWRVHGLLAPFVAARVLTSADVHVARRVAGLCGEDDERVHLAAALAVRALRAGSVCVALAAA